MTPIESRYDTRLVTLIGVAIETIEELALLKGTDPDNILSTSLYLCNKRLHEHGEEKYLKKLIGHYPLLEEAIN